MHWNEKGYYFASTQGLSQLQLAEAIGKERLDRGCDSEAAHTGAIERDTEWQVL